MGIYDDVLTAHSLLVVMTGRALLTLLMLLFNKGFSRPRHLQGKGVTLGWFGFYLFGPI